MHVYAYVSRDKIVILSLTCDVYQHLLSLMEETATLHVQGYVVMHAKYKSIHAIVIGHLTTAS